MGSDGKATTLGVTQIWGVRPLLKDGGRIPALDSVRGVAILMVLATHLTVWKPGHIGERMLYAVLDMGWLGVDLFFVLSGYLITRILLETRDQPGFYRRFYARRALRIFPPYYAVLVLLTVIGVPISWHYWFYLSNIHIPTLGGWPPLLGHLWSLALEEQFYLVWPAVVALVPRRALAPTLIVIAAVSWGGRLLAADIGHPDLLGLVRVDPIAIGAFLAVTQWRVPLVVPATVTALAVVAQTSAVSYLASVTVFASVVSLAATTTFTGPAWLRHVGRVSYTLYLVHLPVHEYVRATFPVVDMGDQFRHWIVAGGIAYGLAALSWRFFESPLLRYPVRHTTPGAAITYIRRATPPSPR